MAERQLVAEDELRFHPAPLRRREVLGEAPDGRAGDFDRPVNGGPGELRGRARRCRRVAVP